MAKGKQEFDLVPLITKVKEYPILYDKNHEGYGDPINTNRAWNGIARELLLPNGEVVRSKWKSTCDIYLKSLKGNKKNTSVKWPWAEHMKFFEAFLIDGKPVVGESKGTDTSATTPAKKVINTKRQRSPLEVATSRRFSRSFKSIEEDVGETDTPKKKARISVLEETVERRTMPTKSTPRKSETVKVALQRLPRSAVETQVSINEEDYEGTSSQSETVNVSPSKVVPIEISMEMKKGPRRLPRSMLKALEAEAEAESQISNASSVSARANKSLLSQTEASPSVNFRSHNGKRAPRMSLDTQLTNSTVHTPLRSSRYSVIPEKLSSNEDMLEKPSTPMLHTVVTGATPGRFKDTVGYFESVTQGSSVKDKRSLFSSPARHSVSALTPRNLPRSAILEEEFALHDAMMDREVLMETSEESNETNSRITIAPATKENMDATDLLFLSYALTIKSFSERKQLEVKRRITQIISQAEIDEMAG